MQNILDNLQLTVDGLVKQIQKTQQIKQWVIEHELVFKELLEEHEIGASIFCEIIDFDHLPHDKVVKVIQAFPGKWNKEPQEFGVHYTTTYEGQKLRCYNGEPPPSCKIIEVEEDVPATPARKRIVRKLQCPEFPSREEKPAVESASNLGGTETV